MLIRSKSSETFNSQAESLNAIFLGYRNWNDGMRLNLEKLGYVVKGNKHIIVLYENKRVTTISCSASDSNTGRQIIRNFRKFWEERCN